MSEQCEHEWVYSDFCYLVNPPRWDRICAKCLAEQFAVAIEQIGQKPSYEELKRRKQAQEAR